VSRRVVVWLIPVLLTLHNAEEAVTFGAYQPKIIASLPAPLATVGARLSHPTFVATVAILSALVFALAWAVDRWPGSVVLLWLLLTVEVAIVLHGPVLIAALWLATRLGR
jgi:hypothetical protein